jgi:hypothetical protein
MCEAKSWQAKHAKIPHHYIKIKPCLKGINFLYLFFCFTMCKCLISWENTEKKVICEVFMHEAKYWQVKHVIIPHHYIKNENWLTDINCPYLCFWFTMCMGPFSWGKAEKIGNLWKFDVWSQIVTGKRHDTATPLDENQPLTWRNQFAISMFLVHHVPGLFCLGRRRKNR